MIWGRSESLKDRLSTDQAGLAKLEFRYEFSVLVVMTR